MITLLRSIFLARISLAAFILLMVPVWMYATTPRLLSLPLDFTYRADVISRQRVFDPEVNDYGPENLSVGLLFFDVVGRQGDTLFVRGIFNAKGATRAKDRSVARIFGVDAWTLEHVQGKGDRDRTGFLFAPRGTGKQDFVAWPVQYNAPASFAFKGETELEGLSVHQYEAVFQTSAPPLLGLYLEDTDVPRDLRFDIRLTVWIEPYSGRLVTYEDRAIGRRVTLTAAGEESVPFSNTFYTPTRDSLLDQVDQARYAKAKAIVVTYAIPGAMVLLGLILLLSVLRRTRLGRGSGEGKSHQARLAVVVPVVMTLVLTLITMVAWRMAERVTNQQQQLWFTQEMDRMERAIAVQLDAATRSLQDGVKDGFTADRDRRFDWSAYIANLEADRRYPGLEAVGFAAYVPAADKEAFLRSSRTAFGQEFTVFPTGDRAEYAPVIHFEPLSRKDRPALGLDLLSDPNVFPTLIAARDTGSPTLSPKVVTARDRNGYEQIGVMLCVPVYRAGVRLSTIQERREHTVGFLYHLIRVSEFVEGALSNQNPSIRLRILDGIWEYDPDKERELYARKTTTLVDSLQTLSKRRVVYLLDRAWTVDYAAAPESAFSATQRRLPLLTLIGGLIFSALVAGIVYFLFTARRRAERLAANMTSELSQEKGQLEKQRALLSLLLEHLPFGVFLSSALTGETLLVNRIGKELLGENAAALFSTDRQLYPTVFFRDGGDPYPQEEFPLRVTLETGRVCTRDDIVLRRPDGKDISIRATSALVQDAPGIAGTDVILILEDITKEHEVAKAKTDFVSLASHQLLTPLTAIGWYVEMLISGDAGELNAEQKEYLSEVHRGNKRMVGLVTDLLNVSRVDLGNLAVHPQPLNLAQECESILFELHTQIESKRLVVQKEYDATLDRYPADPTITRILLQNLLSNAVKYTPDAGSVRVSISKGIQDINIIVADTGCGIPAGERDKIFGKFFRAENARVSAAEGNGLGLYIVKYAVEQAGGTIRFESEENKGTTFFVTFPASGMVERQGSKTLQTG